MASQAGGEGGYKRPGDRHRWRDEPRARGPAHTDSNQVGTLLLSILLLLSVSPSPSPHHCSLFVYFCPTLSPTLSTFLPFFITILYLSIHLCLSQLARSLCLTTDSLSLFLPHPSLSTITLSLKVSLFGPDLYINLFQCGNIKSFFIWVFEMYRNDIAFNYKMSLIIN